MDNDEVFIITIVIYFWNKLLQARSLAILPSFPVGGIIRVADHPNNYKKDDWATIKLKRKLNADEIYCVSTFEQNKVDDTVEVYHSYQNGLDGKVSSVYACV